MHKFNFKEFGRVYIPINIKPFDSLTLTDVEYKIDTGSDISTMSKISLFDLGYDSDWIKQNAVLFKDEDKPTTASGEKVNAGYIQLPLINILGYEAKHWPFQVIIDEDKDFRNLLGRDLLTGFNYEFNNDDDVFTIKRASTFKSRFPFLDKQEIHELES